ncbi:MAG: hypothetical protein PHH28_05710 [Desulfuromonadaceae bacterium]|nr:hypothetical protein [Desulfuromonadaceae bacterium]
MPTVLKPTSLPQRLCSEIQLFDLCDLDSCDHRKGRFCTNIAVLSRFEKIAEVEIKIPEHYISGEADDIDADDGDGEGYDDAFAMEDFDGGEDDAFEDEE